MQRLCGRPTKNVLADTFVKGTTGISTAPPDIVDKAKTWSDEKTFDIGRVALDGYFKELARAPMRPQPSSRPQVQVQD